MSAQKPTILIVDDDQEFAESLVDILSPSGYETVIADRPETAALALQRFLPPVAMLDIRLGRGSGVDLLSHLREQRPDLICVMMTAHADTQSAIAAMRQGAYDYFDKSSEPVELLAVLDRCFEKVRLQEERRAAHDALRVAKEAAEKANRAKSEFLANISHELRTPLNAIIGFSEVMMQGMLGPVGNASYEGYLKDIHDSGIDLLNIINDILDLSKAEAGKLELSEQTVDVAAVLDAVCRLMTSKIDAAGLAVTAELAPNLSLLFCDRLKLKQVLLNLLSNAVKFTAEGHVTVRAFVDRVETPGRAMVRFEVADTGPGIAPDALEHVFQPFRQADPGTTRRHGGTGLGLSIAKRLVELMGGEIGVTSTPGRGTMFWFSLPFDSDGYGAAPSSQVRGSRVLVVDAEPTSRGVLEQYLLSWGAISTGTASAAQAIELARSARERGAPYDAAIVADGDGVDAFSLLARLRADSGSPPAIFVSATDAPGEAVEARRRGYIAYLRKPLKQSFLHDALGDALGTRAASGVPETADPASPPLPPLRILIADDNAVNRRLTMQQLKKLGYDADAVNDGRAAVAAARSGAYDLILMDCEMPELDGFEATRAIRRAESEGSERVTIVAMTANALEGDRERCLASGMDDYLAKPVQLAMLRELLERRAAAAA